MRVKPLALMVDDDPFFLKLIEAVLARLGMDGKLVATPAEFLTAVLEEKPDLMLVDLQLGAESGLPLLEKARMLSEKPLLVVSGIEEPGVVAHALELGANDYILKPFDKVTLATKLGHFVKTAEIEVQQSLLHPVKDLGSEARLLLKGRLLGVDELGLRVLSPHLVPKGTVARFETPWLKELGLPAETGCLVCVTQTSLRPEAKLYEIFGEFEGADTQFLQAVRRWIAGKKKSA